MLLKQKMMHLLVFLLIFSFSFGSFDIKEAKQNKNEVHISNILKKVKSKEKITTRDENATKKESTKNIKVIETVKKGFDPAKILKSNEEPKTENSSISSTRTDEVTIKLNTKMVTYRNTENWGLDVIKALPVTNESRTEPALFTVASNKVRMETTKDSTEKALTMPPVKIMDKNTIAYKIINNNGTIGHHKCTSPENSRE